MAAKTNDGNWLPGNQQNLTVPGDLGVGSSTANSTMADATNGAVNTNSGAGPFDKSKSLSATASANNQNIGGSIDLFNNSNGN